MLRTTDEAYKRMIKEREELTQRVDSLSKMVRSCRRNEREDVSLDELHDLEDQLYAMRKYEQVLSVRIYRIERSTPVCTE